MYVLCALCVGSPSRLGKKGHALTVDELVVIRRVRHALTVDELGVGRKSMEGRIGREGS